MDYISDNFLYGYLIISFLSAYNFDMLKALAKLRNQATLNYRYRSVPPTIYYLRNLPTYVT
jgi:hypothetical protein